MVCLCLRQNQKSDLSEGFRVAPSAVMYQPFTLVLYNQKGFNNPFHVKHIIKTSPGAEEEISNPCPSEIVLHFCFKANYLFFFSENSFWELNPLYLNFETGDDYLCYGH